jgi:hypothetical protein
MMSITSTVSESVGWIKLAQERTNGGLLGMRNISDKFIEKIKRHVLCSITFFRKSCCLLDKVEKYGRAREVTDDIIIRRKYMSFTCWITQARIQTHSHNM